MANNNDRPVNPANHVERWVEERLETLEPAREYEPDPVHARAKLTARQSDVPTGRRVWIALAVAGCLALAALPWPRAMAQELWNRLLLGRVAVVQIDREDLSEAITAVFVMEPQPFEQEAVADAAAAERIAGFRPALPPEGMLKGVPALSVVKRAVLATKPLKTAEMERALASAGVSDIPVPKEWDGLTLTAEAGPVVIAAYDGVEIMQSAAFRMHTPPGFQFGRFMEMAFRVFGRSAGEAKMLGAKLEANPALVLHFPERAPVRDVALRSGSGIIVGDLDGDDLICFFWNTADRIYIVSATRVSEQMLVTLANSVR